ncbi:MAG: TIR domain-containing protein [Bacteroidota bacterium]|jgi:predicted nucleotide-binding protein
MPEQLLKKYDELITTGTQLAPQGGFDASGYNARLQNKYLDWRKACLETLDSSGPIGFPYKQKILGDKNGGFFFQPSAQLILNCMRELYEKVKASPDLASAPAAPTMDRQTPTVQTATDTGGVRVLKPPPKHAASAPPQTSAQSQDAAHTGKVYVVGEANDPLRVQLLQFLGEIGIEEIDIERQHGQMLPLETLQVDAGVRFAFFIINPDDLAYAMFELGHFVGKLGKNRVCVLHMSDVEFPKNVPGVLTKSIVIKLEEASFGLLKDLKASGYQINL